MCVEGSGISHVFKGKRQEKYREIPESDPALASISMCLVKSSCLPVGARLKSRGGTSEAHLLRST